MATRTGICSPPENDVASDLHVRTETTVFISVPPCMETCTGICLPPENDVASDLHVYTKTTNHV